MKTVLFVLLFSLQFLYCTAQTPLSKPVKHKLTPVLVTPEFPGGMEAMYKYMADHLIFPEKALVAGKEGTARVVFVILKDGTISGVQVFKQLGYNLDEEAIRVVQSMPRWKPARYRGRPINFVYTVPVKFVLQ